MFHFRGTVRYKNFKRTLFIITFAVSAIALTLFAFIFVGNKKSLDKQMYIAETERLTRMNDNAVVSIARISSAAATYATIKIPDKSESDYHTRIQNIEKQLSTGMYMIDYISGVRISSDNDSVTVGNTEPYMSEKLGEYKNLEMYKSNNGYMTFVLKNNAYSYQNKVYIIVNTMFFGKQILGSDDMGDRNGFVCDESGNIAVSVRTDTLDKNIADFCESKIDLSKNVDYAQGKACKVYSRKLDNTDLNIVSICFKNYYKANYNSLYLRQFMYFILVFVVVVGTAYFISVATYRPIKQLLFSLDDYFPLSPFESIDEVSYVRNSVKQLANKYATANASVDRQVAALRQQQIISLQLQLSPHFMYNTLDAINWIALDELGADNKISYCIQRTVKMLRSGIDVTSMFSNVKSEIEVCKSCFEVLQIRFGLNINFEIPDISGELGDTVLLKNCLQPIIENAVYHGFANEDVQNPRITLNITETENDITVSVKDNGVGMTEDKLAELIEYINAPLSSEWKHVGLRNVNWRLRLLYGDNYGLKIQSKVGVGTTCSAVMPKVELDIRH
mgnify:FL=1